MVKFKEISVLNLLLVFMNGFVAPIIVWIIPKKFISEILEEIKSEGTIDDVLNYRKEVLFIFVISAIVFYFFFSILTAVLLALNTCCLISGIESVSDEIV